MVFATQEEEEQHLNFDMEPISALIFHVAYKFNLQSQICIKVMSVQIYELCGETEQVLLIDVCLSVFAKHLPASVKGVAELGENAKKQQGFVFLGLEFIAWGKGQALTFTAICSHKSSTLSINYCFYHFFDLIFFKI